MLGLGLYKGKNLTEDIIRYAGQGNYFWQQDYITGETSTYEVEGQIFYIPLEQGQIGYEKFPSSMFPQPIELRGETIEEGFRQIDEWK